MAVGLDKATNGQFDYSVQIIKPSAIESRKQGGSSVATETISSQGQTVFEAIRNLLSKTDKKLFYGHIQVIVIGEELARQGILNVMDMFVRNIETDKRAHIIIARGTTARNILAAEGEVQDIPAVEITNTLENVKSLPKIKETKLHEVIKNINSNGNNPVLGVVTTPETTEKLTVAELDFTGAAVFNKDKLVGWLNPEETTGFLFIENKIKSGIINVNNPFDTRAKVAIEIIRSSTKKDVRFINGEPVIYIEVKQEGNMVDQQGEGDLTAPDKIKILENETAQVIKNEIYHVISLAQGEFQSDIFGLGDIVHKKNLKYWREVENNWNGEFSDLSVEVKVDSRIRRSGLIKKQAGEAR